MYAKYHTEALILANRESGEADRAYALYTRDFGLVRARASAVRTEGSRMRYALQAYARADVSLVKGRRGWRIAGAIALDSSSGMSGKALGAFARLSELTVRLAPGEDESAYLYDTLAEAHAALSAADADVPTIEIVCAARVLYALGYLSAEALESTAASSKTSQGGLFTHTSYGVEHLREADAARDRILSSINRAISETHL